MKKSTKGAVAAAAAGILLLGGAGTLAFWSADIDLPGGTFTAGELKLVDTECSDWTLDDDEDDAGVVVDDDTLFVPGDSITQTCTANIIATGEHLRATVGVTGAELNDEAEPYVTVESDATIGGTSGITEITEANDGDAVTLTVTVTFNETSGNETQGQSATLSDYAVALTQVHD
ncbi:alternate-type signal peptide domain-containing protein [Aeromicrobium sp. NPDC092404]|uniref:alternate-type signal peptide domain-containing protein n=1 Tax=Aeromicrobium sp. NPDC092404 TaxID=3154976 RepID=UPI003415DDC2